MPNPCRICESLTAKTRGTPELHNHVLFESPNFVVIPSLGALVEGWTLLVPKRHALCFGAVNAMYDQEWQTLLHTVIQHTACCWGRVVVFEHGPAVPNTSVGCGVDHAHLHIVPTSADLILGASQVLSQSISWRPSFSPGDLRTAHGKGMSYLFVEQVGEQRAIVTADKFPSQVFRRLIANHIGTPSLFDWRSQTGTENIRATISKLHSRRVHGPQPAAGIVTSTSRVLLPVS
jgi:diadenosine tetraphosphate (Ap4A) HIT family hydrolase